MTIFLFFFCFLVSEFILIIGIVLLDLDEEKLNRIYEAIINDAIANGQMNKDVKDELFRLLTSNHKCVAIDLKENIIIVHGCVFSKTS